MIVSLSLVAFVILASRLTPLMLNQLPHVVDSVRETQVVEVIELIRVAPSLRARSARLGVRVEWLTASADSHQACGRSGGSGHDEEPRVELTGDVVDGNHIPAGLRENGTH